MRFKNYKIKTFFTLVVILMVSYIFYDYSLYHYGKSDLSIKYKNLPNGLTTNYYSFDTGNLGFVFEDKYGFTTLSVGNLYKLDNYKIKISDVLNYKYDSNKLIVNIIDENKKEYYLSLSDGLKSEINITNEDEFKKLHSPIINLKNVNKIKQLELKRNYSLFLVILIAIFTLFVIKSKNKSS